MCKEVSWAVIPCFTDYMVSTDGRIKSLKGNKERIIKVPITGNKTKARKVKLYKEGKYSTINVSTIMGVVFLGVKEGQTTRHINDITDDRLENLYVHNKEAV